MGRTIPSISARLDAKIAQWERFSRLLNRKEREAFSELVSVMRDRRTAIDAADEADIGIAILLALIVHLEAGRNARKGDAEDRDASGMGVDIETKSERDRSGSFGAMRDEPLDYQEIKKSRRDRSAAL